MNPTAVVVARSEHLEAMRERLGGPSPIAVFSDDDSLHVLDAMLARPPGVLAIHQAFAATSRGGMLVARIRSEPRLIGTEIRVLIEDDEAPLILSQTTLAPNEALLATTRPLDRAGTRQAARFPMNRRAVAVNGEHGQLVDLSVTGAQVQVPMRLRLSQVVRIILMDEDGNTRCQGTVAWSILVASGGVIQYRAGLEFINPDADRLAAYCAKFGGAPDLLSHA